MTWLRILPLAVALILVGCTSLEDIRQSEPLRSTAASADYKDLASCVAYAVAPKYGVASTVLERDGVAVLTYFNDINVGFVSAREPVWELKVVRDGRTSRAEFRSVRNLAGGTPWADDVWPTVEKCGRG